MTRLHQASTPVTIDDTMTIGRYEKYEQLPFMRTYDTILRGEQHARYGERANRILDREGSGRDLGDAVHNGTRLDQGWQVSSLPLWWQVEGQEKRTGGLAEEAAKHSVEVTKNAGGPLFLRTISGP